MSRWFRWYEGTSEDGKFRVTARNAGVTVRDVIALWAFMLEDASGDDHRGVCTRNEDFMSAILDFEDGVVERILVAMEEVDMISVGPGAITITHWDKRQFETDKKDSTNADRQRRFRERHTKQTSNGTVTPPVTATKRPETETETETETEKSSSLRSNRERAEAAMIVREFEESFWPSYPNKVGKPKALAAYRAARRKADFTTITVGLDRYISGKPPDRQWLNPATFLNQARWADEPAPEPHAYGSRAPPEEGGYTQVLRALEANRQRTDDQHDDPEEQIDLRH